MNAEISKLLVLNSKMKLLIDTESSRQFFQMENVFAENLFHPALIVEKQITK